MARKKSRFLQFVAIALLLLFAPIFVAAATIAVTGTVTVQIDESGPEGTSLYIPVPALLLDLALFAAPRLIPDGELAQARAEVAPYRDAIQTIADEISSCPEGVLLQVQDGDEHVRVTKNWRTFDIEVESDDADIRVSLPSRFARRVAALLG